MTQCVCFSLPWHAVDVILLLLVVLATRCVASNVMPQATMASHSLLVVVALAAVTLATARDTPAAPTEAAAASGMAIQCDSFDYCRACIANGCGWCGHSTYAIHVLWQRTVDHRCSLARALLTDSPSLPFQNHGQLLCRQCHWPLRWRHVRTSCRVELCLLQGRGVLRHDLLCYVHKEPELWLLRWRRAGVLGWHC